MSVSTCPSFYTLLLKWSHYCRDRGPRKSRDREASYMESEQVEQSLNHWCFSCVLLLVFHTVTDVTEWQTEKTDQPTDGYTLLENVWERIKKMCLEKMLTSSWAENFMAVIAFFNQARTTRKKVMKMRIKAMKMRMKGVGMTMKMEKMEIMETRIRKKVSIWKIPRGPAHTLFHLSIQPLVAYHAWPDQTCL